MADDGEDWEDEGLTPALPTVAPVGAAPKPAFADEEEEDDDDAAGPAVPAPQPNKKAAAAAAVSAKYAGKGGKGASTVAEDTPLDDPHAEKARRQRLVEEADLAAARELFGTALDLDGAKPPKGATACEAWGRTVAGKYLVPHAERAHYQGMLRALLKAALEPLEPGTVKDVDPVVAAVRTDKLNADAAAKAAARGGAAAKKKTLNVGRSGGAAGLDDFVYDDPLDDDVDFM